MVACTCILSLSAVCSTCRFLKPTGLLNAGTAFSCNTFYYVYARFWGLCLPEGHGLLSCVVSPRIRVGRICSYKIPLPCVNMAFLSHFADGRGLCGLSGVTGNSIADGGVVLLASWLVAVGGLTIKRVRAWILPAREGYCDGRVLLFHSLPFSPGDCCCAEGGVDSFVCCPYLLSVPVLSAAIMVRTPCIGGSAGRGETEEKEEELEGYTCTSGHEAGCWEKAARTENSRLVNGLDTLWGSCWTQRPLCNLRNHYLYVERIPHRPFE